MLSLIVVSVGAPISGAVAQEEVKTLTLEQALETTRGRQESWQVLQAQIEQSMARRRQVLARLLPQLNLNARVTRLGQEIAFNDRIVRPQYDWAVGVQAGVVLFDGTLYPLYDQSGKLVEQIEHDAQWQRNLLLEQVEVAYHTLGAAQRDDELAVQIAQLRELQLERAKKLVEANLATQLDVERAQLSLLQAQLDAKEARLSRQLASDQLMLVMGERAGPLLQLEGWGAPPDVSKVEGRELAQRADLLAAQRGIEAAQLGEDAIWRGLLPRLNFALNADQGPQVFSNPTGFQWSMTLSLAWTLYDGGALYARAHEQAQQVQILKLRQQQQLRQAGGQALGVERELAQGQLAAESAQAQVKVAQSALDLAQRRFEQGLATQLDINDATSALVTAQRAVNRAHLRLWLAKTRLRYLSLMAQ